MAIRLALGATYAHVQRVLVWRVIASLALGGGVGWAIGAMFGAAMAGLLIGASATTPLVLGAVEARAERSNAHGSRPQHHSLEPRPVAPIGSPGRSFEGRLRIKMIDQTGDSHAHFKDKKQTDEKSAE